MAAALLLLQLPSRYILSAASGLCFWRGAHRTSVLTLAVLISYMRRTASVIWRLLARVSTMKTSVLLSSIFFMADSVVSGYFRIAYESSGLTFGTDLRENFGVRRSRRVFGRWNLQLYRCFTVVLASEPASFLAAFFALSASLP